MWRYSWNKHMDIFIFYRRAAPKLLWSKKMSLDPSALQLKFIDLLKLSQLTAHNWCFLFLILKLTQSTFMLFSFFSLTNQINTLLIQADPSGFFIALIVYRPFFNSDIYILPRIYQTLSNTDLSDSKNPSILISNLK